MYFSEKEECNSVVKKWQMYFQVSDYKGNYFLNLNNDNNQPICPTYCKGDAWLKYFCTHHKTMVNTDKDFSPTSLSYVHVAILL